MFSEHLGEIKVGAKANEKCYDLSGKFKSMQDLMVSDWRNIKLTEFPNLDENSGKGFTITLIFSPKITLVVSVLTLVKLNLLRRSIILKNAFALG